MFHAGETLLDTGGSTLPENSNLCDALLLGATRISHGYALLKHPGLIPQYKRNNICIELCPISNEALHLCRNIKEHRYPELLAHGLHCSINSDNPSMFRQVAHVRSMSYRLANTISEAIRLVEHHSVTNSIKSWSALRR